MNDKDLAIEGINNAFKASIGNLFTVLMTSMLTEADKQAALDRFRKGFEHSKNVLREAKKIVNE